MATDDTMRLRVSKTCMVQKHVAAAGEAVAERVILEHGKL